MPSVDSGKGKAPFCQSKSHEQLWRCIVEVNQLLATASHPNTAVPQVLACLGESIAADRAYIYQQQLHLSTSDRAMELQCEWLREGCGSEAVHIDLFSRRQGLERWFEAFTAKNPIYGSLATFPDVEQALLRQNQIQALLMMPVFVEQKFWGVIGFDVDRADYAWAKAELAIVEAVADSLGGAIARQQRLEVLQANSLRLQHLANRIPGILLQFELSAEQQLSFPYLSEQCQDILGIAASAMNQAVFEAIVHPEDRAKVRLAIAQSAAALQPLTLDWRVLCAHQAPKWVQMSATPEAMNTGVTRWHAVLFDISDRKQTELQQLQRLAALEVATDIVFIADASGYILYLNQAGQQLFDVAPEPGPEFHLSQVYSPEANARMQATILPAVFAEGTWSGESRLLKPNGKEVPVSQVLVAHKNNQGEVEFISSILRNISASKQTEAELKESKQLLQMVFDTLPQRIFWKDKDSRYLGCNKFFAHDAGLSDSENIRDKTDFDLAWANTDADNYVRDDQEVVHTGNSKINFEETQSRSDGTRNWLRTSKVPLKSEAGEVIGVFGTYEDITDEREAQEQLRRTNAILQAQQDAVPGAVLLIDENRQFASFNRRFSEMWRLPDSLLEAKDDEALLAHILVQLKEPEAFLAKFEYLHNHPEDKKQEEIHLKDERIFSCFSASVRSQEDEGIGRIWYFQDITERKHAELQLQESYALLNSVLNGTKDLIFVKDVQGKYLLVNEATVRMLGSGQGSLVGMDDTQLYASNIAQGIQKQDQKLFNSGLAQTYEQQVPIEGEIRTFLTSKTPYQDAENNILGLVGISRDVTEIQRVREERDRFFSLSSDIMCIIGFDRYLKRVNPSFTRLLGYSREELLAVPFTTFIHPDDRAACEQTFTRLMNGDSFQTCENRWQAKNGNYRWFSWSVTLYNESHIFYATARDITDRRQTEAALQESEQRFRDVTEAAGEYVWEIDVNGIYTFLTEKVEWVKNHTAEALLGQSLFSVVPPEDQTSLQQTLREASTHKRSFRLEHRNITPEGSIVWEEVSGLPMLDSHNQVIGFRGTGLSITAKKQAEASLRLFKQAVESSSDALCITDADSELVYHNQAFAELFEVGNAQELPTGVASNETIYADPQVAQIVFRAIQQGQRYASEVMMRSYAGRAIPALLRANAIRDGDSNVVGSIRAYTDISDRKAAEAKLQIQEEFLRSIYDGTAHRIFALNVMPDSKVVYSGHNRAAEEATGRSSDSIAGLTPIESLGPERGQAIQDICQRCMDSKESIVQEEHIVSDGKESWTLTTFNPLQDHAGRTHRIIGTTFDITPIKQAEAELKEQAQISAFRAEIDSLLTRGEDIRSMLNGCCEVIVKYMEAAFARVWALNEAASMLELQASAGLYTHITGEHAQVPVGQFKIGMIAAEKQAHFTNDVQNDPRISDRAWAKREGMISFAGYPLVVDNHLVGVVALFARHPLSNKAFDALEMVADEIALGIKRKQAEVQLQLSETQLRQQAEALQATLQELQRTQSHLVQSEKMSSLGQLVAGVAHEINNPVNFIYGNLTYARNYTEDLLKLISLYQTHYHTPHPDITNEVNAMELEFVMQDLPKLLNSMKVGAERIQGIVSSLRTFSRMDEAEMKAVDLHAGLESTLMILQNRLKASPGLAPIRITRDYSDLPLVECYAGQLNQVFMNIISNAIDALVDVRSGQFPNKQTACIDIQTQRTEDNQVNIQIGDNGLGILEDIRDRIFDPFFTTKPIGKGTGMGLSISYQIVTEKHGGRLIFESQVGEGTTFTITIPLQQS